MRTMGKSQPSYLSGRTVEKRILSTSESELKNLCKGAWILLDQPVEQCKSQDIIENNEVISGQLVEPHKWV